MKYKFEYNDPLSVNYEKYTVTLFKHLNNKMFINIHIGTHLVIDSKVVGTSGISRSFEINNRSILWSNSFKIRDEIKNFCARIINNIAFI